MTIESLNHYNMRVPYDALDAFEAFYVDVLGFEARREPPTLFWLYAAGQPLVHVTFLDADETARDGAGRTTGVLDHVAFTCGGLAPTIERFRSKNVTYSRLDLPERGFTQLVIYDPLGLKIELNFAGPVP